MFCLRSICAAFFVVHFLLIISVSCRDIVSLVARKLTAFPPSFATAARKVDQVLSDGIAESSTVSNPLRSALVTYLHLAGIDRGYGYFAPNIPGGYKLVFELHYPDRPIEYELPSVNSAAAGLRVASVLDEIGRTRYDPLRDYLVKTLARSVYREHPDASAVRAIFGLTVLPSVDEFECGKRISHDFLYAYDFRPAANTDDRSGNP